MGEKLEAQRLGGSAQSVSWHVDKLMSGQWGMGAGKGVRSRARGDPDPQAVAQPDNKKAARRGGLLG